MGKFSGSNQYLGFAVSFGLTMAITVFMLFKGGQWLDARLGTEPLFMILGVLLGVAAVFKRLLADLKLMERSGRNDDDAE